VVFDLTVAVQVGLLLACGLFVRRMSALFRVEQVAQEGSVVTYKLFGALFFGAVAQIDRTVQEVEAGPRGITVVLDALQLVSLDTSGLDALRQLHKAVLLRGGSLQVQSLQPQPREVFERSGFAEELAQQRPSAEI
ncbi:MAG TPA: STAS domain-containing protein, partial [Burkholderiaceae bacterium]